MLAVAVTLATPELLVVAVVLDSVALAPDEGAAKVTEMPGTGFAEVVFHGHLESIPEGRPQGTVDCGVPPVAVTVATAVLVSAKLAERPPPRHSRCRCRRCCWRWP